MKYLYVADIEIPVKGTFDVAKASRNTVLYESRIYRFICFVCVCCDLDGSFIRW